MYNFIGELENCGIVRIIMDAVVFKEYLNINIVTGDVK